MKKYIVILTTRLRDYEAVYEPNQVEGNDLVGFITLHTDSINETQKIEGVEIIGVSMDRSACLGKYMADYYASVKRRIR